MAQDVKISELDTSGALTGAETLPLVQSGTTFKTLLSVIYTYFQTTFIAATVTLTNKRITKRVSIRTSSAVLTPNVDNFDSFSETALSNPISILNPVGTPTNFQEVEFWFKDNGTSRSITWGAQYVNLTASLPSSTTASKITYIKFVYSSTSGNYESVIALTQP